MVHAPAGHLDDHLLDRLVVVLRIDAVGGAHLRASSNLPGLVSMAMMRPAFACARALDHRQADAAEAEHRDAVARLHLRGVLHRAEAGGHAAAEQADLLGVRPRGSIFASDTSATTVYSLKVLAAHVVVDRLALVREARGAVGHHALALRRAHRQAQVGLARSCRTCTRRIRRCTAG